MMPLELHTSDTTSDQGTILVLGATGQQGGATAAALRRGGRSVRALVRNPASDAAQRLAASGVQLFRGDFADTASIRAAMEGVHGVFSVQANSGAAGSGITDEEEISYGKNIVDLAVQAGVRHLVYASASIISAGPTGLANLDTKLEIEAHVRQSDIASTILRPASFMELLTLPGMGLDKDTLSFFQRPEQSKQWIASEDIGKIAAAVLCKSERYAGQTFAIAGDQLTGLQIQEVMTAAVGRPITYHRFPDTLLAQDEFLRRNAELFDRLGPGDADVPALQLEFGGLMTLRSWLEGRGLHRLQSALTASQQQVALR